MDEIKEELEKLFGRELTWHEQTVLEWAYKKGRGDGIDFIMD